MYECCNWYNWQQQPNLSIVLVNLLLLLHNYLGALQLELVYS